MSFIEITQRILGKREQNGISLSIMLTFDKGKVEIGIFQVAVHFRKYRGDFLFPIFGFSYFYPQPLSQLIDCQHIERSFVILNLILDQVNHLG